MNLARIEMPAYSARWPKGVRSFTIQEQEPLLNNVLRGFKTLRIDVA
jgi:hypothetical protein